MGFFPLYFYVFPGANNCLQLFDQFFIYLWATFLRYPKKYVQCLFFFFFPGSTSHLSVLLGFILETPCLGAFHPLIPVWTVGLFFLWYLFPSLLPWSLFPESLVFFFLVCFILLTGILSSFLRREAWEVNYLRLCMSEGIYPSCFIDDLQVLYR